MLKKPIIAVVLLLVLTFLLPFFAMQNFSPAVDEIAHLSSGYSYLKTGEIKLNPQHPPFIKILAATPLLFLDIKFDIEVLKVATINEWQFGRDFLFNNGADRVIFWGRIPMILLSVLLGWYIYKWGKELFGYTAGLIGLLIYALMPNIVANSQLITTDMGLAAFSFIALYYLWKFVINSNKIDLALSGLFLGLALGSKFSAVFLLPIFLVLLAIYVQKKHSELNWLRKFNLFLKIILWILGLAFLALWVVYFFPSDTTFYWKGLKTVYADHNQDYSYYLNGNFSKNGWWYYFLWAFIIKTPIPFLVALFFALIYWKKQDLNLFTALTIFLPVIMFLFMASWKAHNIGVRYILVVYPFLILFVSGWLSKVFENFKFKILNFKTISIYILAVWYLFSAINTYPDHLAYFNEMIGGSKNGYKYLDDSNIDWGQDLKRLAEYQKNNPNIEVFYVWDTFVDAKRLYGITNLLPLNSTDPWLNPKGKYAVSTYAVVRTKLISQVANDGRLNWMDNYEPTDRIGQSFLIYEFQ